MTTAGKASGHPRPSERAREIVRGAYDLHVHTSPDVIPRAISDLELAHRFLERGLAGFVAKSHYTPTAERAALVRMMVPEVDVRGAITLNSAVGGMNAVAVEIAARGGASIVWMPTFDAENEQAGLSRLPAGVPTPPWAIMQQDLRDHGVKSAAVPVVDKHKQILPEVRSVLQRIALHNIALATSHLQRDEIFALVDAALEEGVCSIIITHPEFPSQNLSSHDQAALAERGAWIEHCFGTFYTKKCPWERLFENIRATGPQHCFLSTDLGQPGNPPVEDGLALMVDLLLEASFTEDEVHQMAVLNTRRIALKEAAR